jgi:hypothetical protein
VNAVGGQTTIRKDLPEMQAIAKTALKFPELFGYFIGSVQLTASTKIDRDLREDRDGRKSGRQETAGTTH